MALFKYCTLCLPPGSLYLLVPGRVHRADQVTEVFPSQADTRLGIHLPCQGLDERDMIKKMMLLPFLLLVTDPMDSVAPSLCCGPISDKILRRIPSFVSFLFWL